MHFTQLLTHLSPEAVASAVLFWRTFHTDVYRGYLAPARVVGAVPLGADGCDGELQLETRQIQVHFTT